MNFKERTSVGYYRTWECRLEGRSFVIALDTRTDDYTASFQDARGVPVFVGDVIHPIMKKPVFSRRIDAERALATVLRALRS